MSHEGAGKKLTTALESLSITNEITTSDNQKSNSAFFTPKNLDAIDSIRQTKKRPDVESILIRTADMELFQK